MENKEEIVYIRRILDGETNLYSYFINRYSSSIFSLIFPIVRIKEDAEELTQDSFLKAFRKLNTFNGECNFSTWLFRIAYNTAVSATRKRKFIFPVFDDSLLESVSVNDMETVFDQDQDEALLQKLELAIDKLNAEERTLITLFYMENKSIAELKIILNLSPENIKVKLFRTRKKLYVLINNQQL